MKYNYLFGPVPSRRLGMSLGVDLVPKKVCSLDCVYCEVGKTTLLTTERKEYISFEKITEEIRHYFEHNAKPDFITLTGSGEPTLHSRIGDVVKYVKYYHPKVPVAVITNGTLLNHAKLRDELMNADVILPSLDAATDAVFNKINRAFPQIRVNDHVEGLVKFRKQFTGKIWLEVFILPGYNMHSEELTQLKEKIKQIAPDAIQLNTLDRPGVLEGLIPATHKELAAIAKHLSSESTEIILKPPKQSNSTAEMKDVKSLIMNTLRRRPCTIDDLTKVTGLSEVVLTKHISTLNANGDIECFDQKRGMFYRMKG